MTSRYFPPFDEETFYCFPWHWLADVMEASALDARDLLLAHSYEDVVIFGDGRGEQPWFEDDEGARLRAICTRQTFSKHKHVLLRQRLLAKYERAARPITVSAVAHRELQQNIKYQLGVWPPKAGWFYRPRAYLAQRWPAWLGNTDLGSRVILLALLAAYSQQGQAQRTAPEQVTLRWQEIREFALRQFGASLGAEDEPILTAKLRKGLHELLVLGLVAEEAEGPLRYSLCLATLMGGPAWPEAALARACGLDVAREGQWVGILRAVLLHCCEPVTRVATVWNYLRRQWQSPYLLEEGDVAELHKYILRQRKAGPLLRHDQLVAGYLQRCAQHQRRLMSAVFVLPGQEIGVVRQTVDGAPIQLPVATAHGLDATQLLIACVRAEGLGVAETQEILAGLRLLVWQEVAGQAPVAVPLVCPRPKSLSVDYGIVVRANDLHRRIDFSQPVEVWVKWARPEPRLTLRCRWRVLCAR